MKPEEAREQLLNKIDLALCRIYPGNINAHAQLREFYDYISELSLNHLVINWYITNKGKIDIEVIDDEVRVIKTDHQENETPINPTKKTEFGELVLNAFLKRNQN